jgi:CHAT domain-containing protein
MVNRIKISCNILIFKLFIGIATLSAYITPVSAQNNNELFPQIQQLYDSAKYYNTKGNYDYAIQLLHTAIKLKKQTNEDNPPEYFKIYNRVGIIYRQQGDFQLAIENYKKSLANTSNNYNQAVINGNIANIYSFKGDYLKAIDFLENTLINLQKSQKSRRFLMIVDNYHNQGYAYKKLGNYQLAVQKYLESIKIANKNSIQDNGNTYYNCGHVYEKLDSLDKAKEFLLKAVGINTKFYGKNNLVSIMSNMNLANFYVNRSQFDKASKIYSTAYNKLTTIVGNKHPFISIYYKHIGDMYNKMGKYHLALESYQQSLTSKISSFNDTSIFNNPSQETIPDMDLLEILKNKSNILVKLSKLENKETNLKAALSTLELTVKFIEQLRMGYLYEDSKLILAEKEHETYMSIIKTVFELLNITENKNYINIAFKYSERSKYAILRESINEETARIIASIPETIQKQEKTIKEQIGITRLQIENENKLVNPDSSKKVKLKEKLFQLTQTQEKIISELEQNYPKYYKRKYENDIVRITELQSILLHKDAIISYELTDNTLYTFIITKDNYNLLYNPIDSTFYKNLKSYSDFLHTEYLMSYESFRTPSYELFQKLIEPILPYIKGKNLLIIPNSELSLISFESLTTKPYIEKEYADYSTEPYLIRQYPVGYSYSATLYANSKHRKKKWNPKFLGFAPDYKNSRDSLDSMPLAIKNIKSISRLIWGKVFTGEDATEYNLKRSYKDYGILHLYAHGNENLENPQFSKIFLSYRNDTIEDGYLYSYEIDELDIEADLVVLASCYSGSGAVNKGEGVLSIGRNFMNSGTPSLITSLWLAYYEPSLFELKTFFLHLVLGKRKDEALRLAKLKYLDSAKELESHPKYWASLVIIGNQDPIFKGYLIKAIILSVILLFILILVFIKVRKRRYKRAIKRNE